MVKVRDLRREQPYQLMDAWTGEKKSLSGAVLIDEGFAVPLAKFDTRAFRIQTSP